MDLQVQVIYNHSSSILIVISPSMFTYSQIVKVLSWPKLKLLYRPLLAACLLHL